MPTITDPQDTAFTFDVLGRYGFNTLDEAINSTKNSPGRQFDLIVIGTGAAGSFDLALDFHHRGALVEAEPLAASPHAERREKNEEEKSKREQLEKDSPAARAPLLAQAVGGQPLENAAFPVVFHYSAGSVTRLRRKKRRRHARRLLQARGVPHGMALRRKIRCRARTARHA